MSISSSNGFDGFTIGANQGHESERFGAWADITVEPMKAPLGRNCGSRECGLQGHVRILLDAALKATPR